MKQLIRLLFGLLPCLFLSCDYSPSGAHFEDINPNPVVVADITLHEEQDTVIMRGNKTLFFKVSLPGRSHYGYALELDGKVIAEGQNPSGYYFDSKKYADGYHTLKYKAYANSGTGSLADKYGAEAIEVSRTWVVLIDNATPVSPPITRIEPENGQLRISWTPYTGRWFKRMELRRTMGEGETAYKTVAVFTDRSTTTWIDNSYVGGFATYAVVVHLDDAYYGDGVPGTPKSYHYPLPAILSTTYNEANEAIVTISSTPFYNNFGSYHLSAMDGHFFRGTDDVNDTVFTFANPGFGKDYYTSLATEPKGFNYNDRHEMPTTWAFIAGQGTAWGPFKDATILRSAAADRFYVWQYGTIWLVDASTMEVLHKRDVGEQNLNSHLQKLAVSSDGRHAYMALGKVIHRLNPATLQTTETVQLEDILPSSSYSEIGLSVSNNNRLLVAAKNYWTKKDTVYLVDMESRIVLAKIKPEAGASYSAVSPDGKALRIIPHVYLAQGDKTWAPTAQFSLSTYDFAFHPTMPLFAFAEGREITFYATCTGAKVQTLVTEKEGYFSIDAGSGYLYQNVETWDGVRTLYVYDIDSGQLIRKVKLAHKVSAFVYKDRVFSGERYVNL